MNRVVGAAFAESQTYRVSHYLGKQAVQNLLVLRFANSTFEPLWNAKCIDHVQITVAEEEGLAQYDPITGEIVTTRAGYYEGIGALRDKVQNHMLQVLCVMEMEPPWSLAPEVVRDAKAGVLNCLRAFTAADVDANVVRGQYIEGDVHRQRVRGYRKEVRQSFEAMGRELPRASVHSTTETFMALKLYIDNWRWAGVPFYLRTGKRQPKRVSEVAIQFKAVPQILFNANPEMQLEPTVLSVRVQPQEGLAMRIACKLPGPKIRIYPVQMEFNYASSFGGSSPEAYERLILDGSRIRSRCRTVGASCKRSSAMKTNWCWGASAACATAAQSDLNWTVLTFVPGIARAALAMLMTLIGDSGKVNRAPCTYRPISSGLDDS